MPKLEIKLLGSRQRAWRSQNETAPALFWEAVKSRIESAELFCLCCYHEVVLWLEIRQYSKIKVGGRNGREHSSYWIVNIYSTFTLSSSKKELHVPIATISITESYGFAKLLFHTVSVAVIFSCGQQPGMKLVNCVPPSPVFLFSVSFLFELWFWLKILHCIFPKSV